MGGVGIFAATAVTLRAQWFNAGDVVVITCKFAMRCEMTYVATILYMVFVCIVFIFASYSFASNDLSAMVMATVLLAGALFIGQTRSWTQKVEEDGGRGFCHKLKSFWMWRNLDVVVVGVATHYSALMIGVSSFGTVVLDVPLSNTTIIIVIVQQVFLNYAATILINAFRKTRIEKS